MDIHIRQEQPADYKKTEQMTREAFATLDLPGREDIEEHFLLHNLRGSNAFVPQLCLVAEVNGEIMGNIAYSKNKIINDNGQEWEILTFGPLGVLPQNQKQGIGALLVEESLLIAKALGYKGIIIFGHPTYYPRFGFENAKEYNITTEDGQNFDAFMALELFEGALQGVSGKYIMDAVFYTDKEKLAEYDKQFTENEKTEGRNGKRNL